MEWNEMEWNQIKRYCYSLYHHYYYIQTWQKQGTIIILGDIFLLGRIVITNIRVRVQFDKSPLVLTIPSDRWNLLYRAVYLQICLKISTMKKIEIGQWRNIMVSSYENKMK